MTKETQVVKKPRFIIEIKPQPKPEIVRPHERRRLVYENNK